MTDQAILDRINSQSEHLGRARSRKGRQEAVQAHSTTRAKAVRPQKAQRSFRYERRWQPDPDAAPELVLRDEQGVLCEPQ
jgi:hypothetical protein